MKISELEVLKVVRSPFEDRNKVKRPGISIRCMDAAVETPIGTFIDVNIEPEDETRLSKELAKPGTKHLSLIVKRVLFPYQGSPMVLRGEGIEVK